MIKGLYSIAIGLLFAAFIGFGISTFYPAPKPPAINQPAILSEKPVPVDSATAKIIEQQNEQFQIDMGHYQRNLSLLLIGAAILVTVVSLFTLESIEVVGNGITLGGIILLFAGIVSSFNAQDQKFRFMAVSAGLLIILLVSWWKFVRPARAQ